MSAAARPDAAALLASPVRRSLVEELRRREDAEPADPGMTAAQLAEHVGLHVTTTRFHLDQLVHAGVLDAHFERQATAGRPRKLYQFVGTPTANPSEPLLLLAEAMTATVDGRPESPDEAGRRWVRENLTEETDREPARTPGQWLARVGELLDLLDRWGYHPDLATHEAGRTAEIELTDCPFFGLARSNEAVVCGVHHGLVAQAMSQFGEPDTAVTLEPFVTPDRCVARLRRRTPFPLAAEASSGDITRGSA